MWTHVRFQVLAFSLITLNDSSEFRNSYNEKKTHTRTNYFFSVVEFYKFKKVARLFIRIIISGSHYYYYYYSYYYADHGIRLRKHKR